MTCLIFKSLTVVSTRDTEGKHTTQKGHNRSVCNPGPLHSLLTSPLPSALARMHVYVCVCVCVCVLARARARPQSLSGVWFFETPMDCSPPGSSFHGIFQARILECVAISSFGVSSWPRDRTHISCLLHWQAASLSLSHLGSPTLAFPILKLNAVLAVQPL